MNQPLGTYTKFDALTQADKHLVELAWSGADSSAQNSLCFQSNFPVGAAILAANKNGRCRNFRGCNVENASFSATICAERNAATTAALEGYTRFLAVAVVCRKYPGGSPCGLCRQVLNQFGREAVLLNIVDFDSNVRRALVGDLLPGAASAATTYGELSVHEQRLVRRLIGLKRRSHVPYSARPRAALFVASNDRGKTRAFAGVSDDNASYGGSALAETVAMRTAVTAGYGKDAALWVTVEDPAAVNPVDGESLQVLREFGADAPIMLVGPDKEVVRSSLAELLPDSFGPESL